MIFLVAGVIGLFTVNYSMLGKPMEDVLKSDPRNSGIRMEAHYGNYIIPSVLVLDVKEVSNEKSPADVFRVLLQYASEIQKVEFETVNLNSKGKTKFILNREVIFANWAKSMIFRIRFIQCERSQRMSMPWMAQKPFQAGQVVY